MHEHADGHRDAAGEDAGQQGHDGDEGDRDVLPHHPHRAPGQIERLRQPLEPVAHQGDVRGLDGHTGAGRAHGHADVRRRQGRGVVDAVTDHRDDAALGLQGLDRLELVLGQQARPHVVDAHLPGHGLRDAGMVAGQHHDLADADPVQRPDHARGLGPEGVCDGEDAERDAVDDDRRRGPARLRELGRDGLDPVGRGRIHAALAQHRHVAHGDDAAVHLSGEPAAEDDVHIRGQRAVQQAAVPACRDDRRGQRVVRGRLEPCGPAQHLVLGPGLERDDVCQLGGARREGAGLVDGDGVDLRGALKELPSLDEHAVLGAAADPCHDRDRDGDHEGARAADDQQGQGQGDVPRDQAGSEGQHHDRRGVPAGEAVHELLGPRTGLLRRLDAVDDARQRGVGADAPGLHLQQAGRGDGARVHGVTVGLLRRDGLARDGCLVHGADPGEHHAVHRHPSAGLDEDGRAGGHLVGRHGALGPVCVHDDGGLGRRGDEVRERRASLRQGRVLEGVAEGEEEGHRGGLPEIAEQ
ncbi:Uncharacterised protein [Streptococcus pneumoniae]|nr:Uncharacterised protein [Streptococcus pneumoniae]